VELALDVPSLNAASDGGAVNPMSSRDQSELIPAAGVSNSLVWDPTFCVVVASAAHNPGSKTSRKPSKPRSDLIYIKLFLFPSTFIRYLKS
jgi:hypothetical protein